MHVLMLVFALKLCFVCKILNVWVGKSDYSQNQTNKFELIEPYEFNYKHNESFMMLEPATVREPTRIYSLGEG